MTVYNVNTVDVRDAIKNFLDLHVSARVLSAKPQ